MKFFNIILKSKYLVIIIFFASILRLWNLNTVPPHLTPDEAALGYNAYSILKTGKDEHGIFLPLVFKSFGDYKPGFYVYATVPVVAVFGFNEWSVRLPSALFGILSVYLLYLITQQIFPKNKNLPLAISFVAAINPWLIYFSRGAWEANMSLTLTLLGMYFFFKALRESRFLIFSTIFFGLTLITYQGAKLSSAIVILLLIFTYWNEFWKVERKYLLSSIIVGSIISLPIVLSLLFGQTGRLKVFSIFSNSRSDSFLQNMFIQSNEKKWGLNYFLFHSDSYDTFRGILGRWFNHFSGRFLFFEGDWPNPRHSAPYQGMLLMSDLLLLLYGLFDTLKNKLTKEKLFIILWLILAPLPAVLTRDQVHAVRALNMAIPLIFIIAFGLNSLMNVIYENKYKSVLILVGSLVYLGGILYFFDAYFVHVPSHNSKLWEYGYKQIVQTITPIQNNYETIKIQQSFSQPYIYFLFYQKYDPAKYQKQVKFVESGFKGDVGYIEKLDNIQFVPIDWSINRGDHGALIIGDGVRIPMSDSNNQKEFKLIKDIYYLNNRDLAFRIIEVK